MTGLVAEARTVVIQGVVDGAKDVRNHNEHSICLSTPPKPQAPAPGRGGPHTWFWNQQVRTLPRQKGDTVL